MLRLSGDSGCGKVCVSGSLAAAEHSVLRGGVVGVSGWSLLQLQRMTPLFRKPLRAVKLEMDFLAVSQLRSLNFQCLIFFLVGFGHCFCTLDVSPVPRPRICL